jgi:hypothetical protein
MMSGRGLLLKAQQSLQNEDKIETETAKTFGLKKKRSPRLSILFKSFDSEFWDVREQGGN